MYAKTREEAATVVLMNQSVNDWGDGDGDGEAEWWPKIQLKPSVTLPYKITGPFSFLPVPVPLVPEIILKVLGEFGGDS